ncbi:hypothetical protein Lal_00033985, partial [Lupinus albus]
MEYVQRWAGLAVEVKLKLPDEESVSMFLNTLQPPFFDLMIKNVHSDFRHLITIWRELRITARRRAVPKAEKDDLYDLISMSYSELLPQLFQRSLLTPFALKKVETPYPHGFNPNSNCKYHTRAIDHFTKDYDQLKSKVPYLINSRLIHFQRNVL